MLKKYKMKTPSKSIKMRLVVNFMLVILISVVTFEGLIISLTRYYFYSNVESILTNQIEMSTDIYGRYFSNVSLEDNILDNVDIFWKQTSAEVQILNPQGKVLMDSIGLAIKDNIDTSDVKTALRGNKGKWVGIDIYNTKVMAISYPLKSKDKTVGVLRFITSLNDVDNTIGKISVILIMIGIGVIIIGGLVSLFLANGIVHPLRKVTGAAEKMAQGDLKTRILKKKNDEIGILGDTLNFMAEEIEKKEQIKNEFISSISHELRTPLTSIKGWAITLNTDEVLDRSILKDGLTIIENESERLTSMVEELLDFSRFVSGKVKLKMEPAQICDIVKYIEKYMRPRSEREGINFIVECGEEIPMVNMDKDRIKQVLINLLDNAFKFTAAGGTVILTTVYDSGYIILRVKDNGSGIDEEDLPRIKEKFYKGKNSKAHTGIGLSICDEIIKMHSGELIIESKIDFGTAVTVLLPIENKESGDRNYEIS